MTAPLNISQAVARSAALLSRAGIERPRFEARILLGHALGHAPGEGLEEIHGHPERQLDESASARLEALSRQRAERRPMAQILGRREFWSLSFRVNENVLDPRPDSETLIEAALKKFPERDARLKVLDLGTGSGCLLLSFLSERPESFGVGVDISPAAIDVARQNSRALGMESRSAFCVGNWTAGLRGVFDLIISNPPYIPTDEIDTLEKEVSHFEPRRALCGGADGLDSYRLLTSDSARLVAADGCLILEVGAGQANRVSAMITAQTGFGPVERVCDLGGQERALVTQAPRGSCGPIENLMTKRA